MKNTKGERLSALLTRVPKSVDVEENWILDDNQTRNNEADNDDINSLDLRDSYSVNQISSLRRKNETPLNNGKYRGHLVNRTALNDDSEQDQEPEENGSGNSEGVEESETEASDSEDSLDSEKKDYGNQNDLERQLKELDDLENAEPQLTLDETPNIERGNHIREQIKIWDLCLETRIRLQKALATGGRFPQIDLTGLLDLTVADSSVPSLLKEIQTRLRDLLGSLTDCQESLLTNNHDIFGKDYDASAISKQVRVKRAYSEFSSDLIWNDIAVFQKSLDGLVEIAISKWSERVQTPTILSQNKKFKAVDQNTWSQIQHIMTDRERIFKRTHLLRSPYRVIGKVPVVQSPPGKLTDENADLYDDEIFDDTDFYQQLLRELIETRTGNLDDPIALGRHWLALKQLKSRMKKNVDTKASKGRKIRYEVQAKLANFMAPRPLLSTWHDDMIRGLLSSLFGK